MRRRRATCSPARLSVLLTLLGAAARANNLSVEFDAGLSTDPVETRAKLAQLEGRVPAWFVRPAGLSTLQARQVTMYVFPEMAQAFQRAAALPPNTPPMSFAATTGWCVRHAAFTAPATLLAAGAAPGCPATETVLRGLLTDVATACREVEEPERYVLRTPAFQPPGNCTFSTGTVNDTSTASVEALMGLAGEALARSPVPQGLLPPDWVPTLRSVVWKLRAAPIATALSQQRQKYAQATATLAAQAACFDATAAATLGAAVAQLDAELAAAQLQLSTLQTEGQAQVAQEARCLAARARGRNALDFPSMTVKEREFVAFWLGGVMWRFRGGGVLPLGCTQQARTFFNEKPFRRIGRLAGADTGEEAGYRIYTNIFDGWGQWMDLGTYQPPAPVPNDPNGQDLYEDLVQLVDRGRQQVADAPGLPFVGISAATKYLMDRNFDATALYLGGLDMGPCYLQSLDALNGLSYATAAPPPYGTFAGAGEFTAWGEFCMGASVSLGLARSLLNGFPTGQPPLDLCQGKRCGADGCGGTCGTCPNGQTCSAAGACQACMPSCLGKDCGDDGCGGQCGVCLAGQACSAGLCLADADGGNGAGGGSASGGGASGGGEASGGGVASGGGGASAQGGGAAGGGATANGGGAADPAARGCGCGTGPGSACVVLGLLVARRRPRAARVGASPARSR